MRRSPPVAQSRTAPRGPRPYSRTARFWAPQMVQTGTEVGTKASCFATHSRRSRVSDAISLGCGVFGDFPRGALCMLPACFVAASLKRCSHEMPSLSVCLPLSLAPSLKVCSLQLKFAGSNGGKRKPNSRKHVHMACRVRLPRIGTCCPFNSPVLCY